MNTCPVCYALATSDPVLVMAAGVSLGVMYHDAPMDFLARLCSKGHLDMLDSASQAIIKLAIDEAVALMLRETQ